MDEIRLGNPPILKLEHSALKMQASIWLTPGRSDFSPFATIWELELNVKVNGQRGHYAMIEYFLEALVGGKFVETAHNFTNYKQTRNGVSLSFSPGLIDWDEKHQRRYVKKVEVNLNFLSIPQSSEALLSQLIALTDYGLSSLWPPLTVLAPAVFTDAFNNVNSIVPLLGPLHRALCMPSIEPLRLVLESHMLRDKVADITRKQQPWSFTNQAFFAKTYLATVDPEFILEDDDSSYSHVPIYLDDLQQGRI